MNLLFHIVYAGHASGTHHKLALDALRHLKSMDADLWQRLFLANAKIYLDGSKAPDKEFKDFKNHVLHTRDGYWGGAPDKVRSWYQHLVEALTLQDWQTAVYCAGVLSHYYTDPLHPFHTAQSEAENNIHRAVEWSISKAYDELYALGKGEFDRIEVDISRDPNWLEQLVCQGAEMANGYYEKLIAHYDIQRGVSDPPSGLDQVAKRIVSRLIWYASISFAAVLDRAIDESNMHPPETALLPATLLATVQVPIKVLTKRMADAEERRQVERMYDELIATGTVNKTLLRGRPRGAGPACRGGAGQVAAQARAFQGISLHAARSGGDTHRPASRCSHAPATNVVQLRSQPAHPTCGRQLQPSPRAAKPPTRPCMRRSTNRRPRHPSRHARGPG